MRIAIVSDIHGNFVALQAALKRIEALQVDALWCLGDTVGYGPNPRACVAAMRERADICLAGNHDLAVVGAISLDTFNPRARAAVLCHRKQLPEPDQQWLAHLPSQVTEAEVTLAHGSPRDPVWEYVNRKSMAKIAFEHFDTPLCLVGHSHVAGGWHQQDGRWRKRLSAVHAHVGSTISLDEGRWILNPGSVGQPRDGDPRLSFGLLDTEANTWVWQRVEYDIATVAQAIRAANLPDILATRLHVGQ